MSWSILLLGIIAGIFSGIIGIGGGIIMVPALVYLSGMTQHRAQGTSLAVLLAPAGALAVMEYWKKGEVDLRVAVFLAIGFVVGGYFGARFAQYIPDFWLKKVFALTLIGLGAKMLFFK